MRALGLIALSLALLVSAPTATAGKAKGKGHGKPPTSLRLVTASPSVTDTTACGNPYDMQPDKSVWTTICIPCPSLPDGPSGDTLWTPTLYAVATDEFDYGLNLLAYTYGCDTGSWYYWT